MLEALHLYLPELNPILSFANLQQAQLADFFMNGAGSSASVPEPLPGESPRHYLRQYGAINTRSLGINLTRPPMSGATPIPRLKKGEAPLLPRPGPYDGTEPATP